jgi:hypothetical protein
MRGRIRELLRLSLLKRPSLRPSSRKNGERERMRRRNRRNLPRELLQLGDDRVAHLGCADQLAAFRLDIGGSHKGDMNGFKLLQCSLAFSAHVHATQCGIFSTQEV